MNKKIILPNPDRRRLAGRKPREQYRTEDYDGSEKSDEQ